MVYCVCRCGLCSPSPPVKIFAALESPPFRVHNSPGILNITISLFIRCDLSFLCLFRELALDGLCPSFDALSTSFLTAHTNSEYRWHFPTLFLHQCAHLPTAPPPPTPPPPPLPTQNPTYTRPNTDRYANSSMLSLLLLTWTPNIPSNPPPPPNARCSSIIPPPPRCFYPFSPWTLSDK